MSSMSTFTQTSTSGPMPSFVNPREKMRLAKLALMEDEEREDSLRKERRLSRRASSVAEQGNGGSEGKEALRDTDPYTRLPSYGILRRPSLSPLKTSSYPSTPSSSLSPVERPIQPRRRSSRVRFSEDPLPSANSSPGRSQIMMRGDSAESILEEPPVTVHPPVKSAAHTEVDEEDKVEMLAPSSPVISRRGSNTSISSAASDPFGLQGALGSPVPSTISRLNSDAFTPQPLPYTQLDKVLAKLNREDSLGLSTPSDSPCRASLSAGETLRQAIERPSLLVPASARTSTSQRSSLASRAASSATSRASTTTHATPSSLRSSAVGASFASSAETSSSQRAYSGYSTTASSLSLDSVDLPSRLTTLRGAAYASLIPTSMGVESATVQVPTLNRQQWHDIDVGLSPRSGPTPVPPETSWVPIVPVPDFGPRPEQFETIPLSPSLGLSLPTLFPVRRAFDSIDLLPQPDERNVSEIQLGSRTGQKIMKGHQRTESDFSLDLAFPLPPDRLNVKLVTPVIRRKKASLSLAPRVDPSMALLVGCQGSVGESELADSAVIDHVETPASKRKSLTIDTVLCADAYSLTAAVLQVGTPTSSSPVSIKKGHSPSSSVDFTPRPASPGLSDMIEQTLRARKSTVGFNMDEEESDLDTAAPLVQVALKSRILSPNSRLLRPRNTSQTLRRVSTTSTLDLKSGVSLTRGLGWSGSESEEEEWVRTVRSIAQRKASRSSIGSTRSLPARRLPSVRTKSTPNPGEKSCSPEDRYSQTSTTSTSSALSEISTASTNTTHLLTPSASLDIPANMNRTISSGSISSDRSGSITPGKYPWGKSSPTRPSFADLPSTNSVYSTLISPVKTPTRLPSAPKNTKPSQDAVRLKMKRVMSMPLPKRVEDWGEPEILIDGDTDYWNGEIDLNELEIPMTRYPVGHASKETKSGSAAGPQRFGFHPSMRTKRVSSSIVPRAGSPDFSVLGHGWGESLLTEEIEF